MNVVGLMLIAMVGGSEEAEMVNPRAVEVGVFGQEVSTFYTSRDSLPSEDVLAVAVGPQGTIFAGTMRGLARWDGRKWKALPAFRGEPVQALEVDGDGAVLAVSGPALYRLRGTKLERLAELIDADQSPKEVVCLCWTPGTLYLGTTHGLFHVAEQRVAPVAALNRLLGENRSIRQLARGPRGEVAAASGAGLFFTETPEQWRRLLPGGGDRSWAPTDVRGVAFDALGRLWFASPQGVGCSSQAPASDDGWSLYTGVDGLPYNDFTVAACGVDGGIWFGTRLGAIHYDGNHWAYRQGLRWLPDDEVRAIAVTAEGDAWFATARGVSQIERRPMTLAQKAAFYEDEIDKYHRRTPYGYVDAVLLKRPGDKSEWIQQDSDNDGLYTGMYGAAECFAYGATKDPRFKKRAKAAFEALAFLSEVTQGGSHPAPPGFVARTILPTSGPDPNRYYTIERDRKRQEEEDALWKVIHPRWPVSADGKWYWKCDTSSDELDGHFFLYGLYYDLVAETDREKARVREVVDRVSTHLIEHDFQLVDHDGKPTRWARFSPKDLNNELNWFAERGLNSLSILAHLAVAEHVTGDSKYREAIDALVNAHKYAMNALCSPKLQLGPGSFVQFDEEMAFMNYYHLIRYEKDPRLRDMYVTSLYYYMQIEQYELSPLFNFIYAACCDGVKVTDCWGTHDYSPPSHWFEEGVNTLKHYPINLIDWPMRNSHRIDITPLPAHVREEGNVAGTGYRANGKVLPMDERVLFKWGDDLWRLDTGGEGKRLADGAPFLLPYYMGLYHGFIKE